MDCMNYGMDALGQSIPYATKGVMALAIAAPLVGAASVTYLALKILGAPAMIIYGATAIPVALATPGLVLGAVSLVAAAFFAGTGLAALSVGIPFAVVGLAV